MNFSKYPEKTAIRYTIGGLFGALLILYLTAFGYTCLHHKGAYSPDSIVYINTAEMILKGAGITTSFCDLHEAVATHRIPPVPMTGYNPLYSFFIAAAALLLKPAGAALLVAVLGYAACLMLVFMLSYYVSGMRAALMATAALLHFPPLIYVATHAWSETLALAFLSLFLLLPAIARKYDRLPILFIAGLVGGLAFLTRLALAPVFPLGMLLLLRRKSWKQNALRLAIFTLGFSLIAIPALFRKYLDIAPPTTRRNLIPIIRELGAALTNSIFPEHWLVQDLYRILPILLLGWIFYAWKTKRLSKSPWAPQLWNLSILPLWALAYLLFLAYTRMFLYIDPVGPRLILPTTFALLIFSILLIVSLTRPPFGFCAGFALIVALTAVTTEVQEARLIAQSKLPPVYEFTAQSRHWETLAWLKKEVGPEDLVIAEDALDWPLFWGAHPLLYYYGADPRPITLEAFHGFLEEHRSKYRHIYLIIKPAPDPPEASSSPKAIDIAPVNTPPLVRLKDGLIFEL